MRAAYYIVLERKIEGLDIKTDGSNFSRDIEILDDAAASLGVSPLSEFISIDPTKVTKFMKNAGMGEGKKELPPLQQFSAEEGLTTIRALLNDPASKGEGVADDLRDLERILNVAAKQGVNWHFEIDF